MVFHVSFFIITFFILFKRKQMDLNLSELQNLLGSVSALFSSEVKTLFIKRIKIYRVYMHDKTEYQNRKLFVYFDPLMSSTVNQDRITASQCVMANSRSLVPIILTWYLFRLSSFIRVTDDIQIHIMKCTKWSLFSLLPSDLQA